VQQQLAGKKYHIAGTRTFINKIKRVHIYSILIINVFYFNCAFTDPIGSKQNTQKGIHNALLYNLGGRPVSQFLIISRGIFPGVGYLPVVMFGFLFSPGTVKPERFSML
jgi:hypothetical protein